jgi:hypothetical protein
MATLATLNQQKLIIPNKNYQGGSDPYATDMRQIEMWANAGIIRKLIAGSGVTILNPTGPNPTISAAGGGGGANANMILLSGADSAQWGFGGQLVFLGPSDPATFGFSYWPIFDNATGANRFYTPASNWIVAILAGQSVCIFPEVRMAFFTGGPISVEFQIATWAINETNVAVYQTGPINFTSGMTYQTQDTDYSLLINGGGDITLTAGSGTTGNGLVSATSGAFYIASVTCQVTVPTGTTMTGDAF